MMLGRFGEAWRALQAEVADEDAPVRSSVPASLARALYFFELAAYERAATTLRRVVEQAIALQPALDARRRRELAGAWRRCEPARWTTPGCARGLERAGRHWPRSRR